ncbi:MAG: hypothetical protein HYY42_06665 [Chloroflexi bacterium]|nr:hypothetical protein [Chloroflexota bacterium]
MAMHGGHGGGGGGFFHEDEILGKAYDARLMRRLLRYVRPYAGLVVVALVLLLVLSATQIAPPIIAKFIIDQAITPAVAGQITAAEGLSTLGILGMLYLAILAANATTSTPRYSSASRSSASSWPPAM